MTERAQMALDALRGLPTRGIPIGLVHIMEHAAIERFAGAPPGAFAHDPHGVYVRMLQNIGVNLVDQYLAENALTMGSHGYERGDAVGAPTEPAVLDGVRIDGPEAVCEHLTRFAMPRLAARIAAFDAREAGRRALCEESLVRQLLGAQIYKAGYGHLRFPTLEYGEYGYAPYFAAFALYPELMDARFAQMADYAQAHNAAIVEAFARAGLHGYERLDHDMADSRGLLTGVRALERAWLPGLRRSIAPAVRAGWTLLWHCDGNLMPLLPALIECGVNGFQGFQYEDGMDYARICRMRVRGGDAPIIQAGVSVTRELPFGTPSGIRAQLRFLVENGPERGLFLSFSSTCVPGTPLVNLETAIEGMRYYRDHGRSGQPS